MMGNTAKSNIQEDPEYYGAGYSVFFREDKLLSHSEIYNWWKMKTIVSRMLEDEKFNKNKDYQIFEDNTFDVITCSEVMEHQEMPYLKHVFVIKIDDWVKTHNHIGFRVEELKRGSIVYGGPFFDKHVKLMGFLLIFDNILDHLTYGYSWDIIIKARKKGK